MGKVYQVQVVGIKGEKKTVDVAHSEADFNSITVEKFKVKLEEKFLELKGQKYTIMYTDVKLEDGEMFSVYQIQDRSTVVVILRLPGGLRL